MSAAPFGTGHINDSYIVTYDAGDSIQHYIFQRINRKVFPNPTHVLENFERITKHIKNLLSEAEVEDSKRRVLNLVRARDGLGYTGDESGDVWRATRFISGTINLDRIEHPALAFEAGRCYGEYQRQMRTLDPALLHETIPDFHDTRVRFNNLVAAVQRDPHNRAQQAKEEIEFAVSRERYVDRISDLQQAGLLPTRIAHNDTKINNLLIDSDSHKALCVTDLDTTMPGTIIHDFGDMVRTGTISSLEDEETPESVTMRLDLFEALAEGYLSSTNSFITDSEIKNLVPASETIVQEIGMRFLTDYLDGDVYFKTDRPEHNLQRCRVQFKLLSSIEAQRELMQTILDSLWSEMGSSI